MILSKRINPQIHIDIQDFDRSRLNELTQMGWWSVINQIGSLLFLQIDLIIVNLLFGATASGEYAVVFIWATLIRGIAYTLSGILNPMILTYYAKEKFDQIIQVSKSAVKGLGLFMALPIGLYLWIRTSNSHVLGRFPVRRPFTSYVGAYFPLGD